MIRDLDSRINKITETENYMEQLQQITGNMFSIDKCYFTDLLKRVDVLERMIVPLLKQYFPTGHDIISKYIDIHSKYDVVQNSIVTRIKEPGKKSKKPAKEVKMVNHKYVGKDLFNSDWFNMIRELETKSNDLLESFDCSDYAKVEAVYKTDPMLHELKVFYGQPIDSPERLNALKNLNKVTNELIDVYTKPLYNIHKKVESNWGKLGNIFRDAMTKEDIIDMLEQFIICKYRCELTGNNKYYMKLFESIASSDKLNGSKFFRIVDSIDNSKLDKKSNVFAFSESIKNAIHSIANKDRPVEDIIAELQETMNIGDKPKVTEEAVTEEPEDLFADALTEEPIQMDIDDLLPDGLLN